MAGVSVLKRFLPLVVALVSWLCGCISDKGGVDKAAAVWTPHVTTRKEVVAQWGNPDAVFGDVWVWRDRRVSGGKLKVSFMMVGATVKNTSSTICERRLRFETEGRLVSEEMIDYTPKGENWSINPWF